MLSKQTEPRKVLLLWGSLSQSVNVCVTFGASQCAASFASNLSLHLSTFYRSGCRSRRRLTLSVRLSVCPSVCLSVCPDGIMRERDSQSLAN